MKELTIEDKAKCYDEAIEKGKQIQNTPYIAHWDIMKEVVEHLLPELKESEDKKIINEITELVMQPTWKTEKEFQRRKELCVWIEKQGKQKSANKVEPKFKIGDTVKDPYGDVYHIIEINNDSYKTDNGRFILFENQEVYTLSNLTTWSEEDEKFFKTALWHISYSVSNGNSTDIHCDTTNWLKSLKDRYTWKPSDEQMERLKGIINSLPHQEVLYSLYQDLKKLKG